MEEMGGGAKRAIPGKHPAKGQNLKGLRGNPSTEAGHDAGKKN